MKFENIKLYNSNFILTHSLFNLHKITSFKTIDMSDNKNYIYSLYCSKSFKVLYFTRQLKEKNILIMKKRLEIKPYDKIKGFDEAFNFMSFLTKLFKFDIYSMNFSCYKITCI